MTSKADTVYVVRYGPRLHKIGITGDFDSRFKALQKDAAVVLDVVKLWTFPNFSARLIEQKAHELLLGYKSDCRRTRERFSVTARAACTAVELAIALLEMAATDDVDVATGEVEIAVEQAADLPAFRNRLGFITKERLADATRIVAGLRKAGVHPDSIHVEWICMIKDIRPGDVVYIDDLEPIDAMLIKSDWERADMTAAEMSARYGVSTRTPD